VTELGIELRYIKNKNEVKVHSYWWDGDDLILDTDKGQWRLENAYLTSMTFGDLDYGHSEECIIEQNVQWSRNDGSTEKQEG